MSTLFGILKKGCEPDESNDDNFIEVAFRGNVSGIALLNPLAAYLPPDMKVYPLDNTAQGIYTIGDILKEIEEE